MSSNLNQGAEQLARAGSISDLAKLLNVNPRTISGWRSGAKLPNDASRANLERVVGIPQRAWGLRVQSATPMPAVSLAPASAEPVDPDWLHEVIVPLEFAHPRALHAIYESILQGHPRALAEHAATVAAVRARHRELFDACAAAELALGRALATEIAGDEFAAAFLREHAVSSAAGVGAPNKSP